jgi:hypothetical protein
MFFVIWGFRRYVTQLAVLTLLCSRCQQPSAHPLRKVVTKLTLFWIPLFPTSTKYVLQCTYCGYGQQIPKDEAERLLATPPAVPIAPQTAPETNLPPQYRD